MVSLVCHIIGCIVVPILCRRHHSNQVGPRFGARESELVRTSPIEGDLAVGAELEDAERRSKTTDRIEGKERLQLVDGPVDPEPDFSARRESQNEIIGEDRTIEENARNAELLTAMAVKPDAAAQASVTADPMSAAQAA